MAVMGDHDDARRRDAAGPYTAARIISTSRTARLPQPALLYGTFRVELLKQAKADPIQLGGLIAAGQLVHRLSGLVQMVAERFRQVPLNRHGISWLLTIRRAQLSVRGPRQPDRLAQQSGDVAPYPTRLAAQLILL